MCVPFGILMKYVFELSLIIIYTMQIPNKKSLNKI
jgi:hypothetical protein